ncbi:MAG: hypothetical protein JXQ99_04525 [Hyphomicrobiaceae bacterium]
MIEEQRGRPGPRSSYQSRMRLRPNLLDNLAIKTVEDVAFLPADGVKLKNREGQLVDYKDTARSRKMRREIAQQNEAIMSLEIALVSPSWHQDDRGLLRSTKSVLNPEKLRLYRVFKGGWNLGGRLYGGWWQNMPSSDRAHIRIDGDDVVEHDFSHIHPTLMSAIADVKFDGKDPYVIDGFERKLVKRSFNILLNASTLLGARRAITQELQTIGTEAPGSQAKELINAIQRHHPRFSHFWGTGLGLRLQSIDSDLCVRVLARMRAAGVVALPVHDSFIVPDRAASFLLQAMETELTIIVREIRCNTMKI